MKEVLLNGGRNGHALVDDEDFELVNKCSWQLSSNGYAITTTNNNTPQKGSQRMHRLIMNPPIGMFIDHIDGNRLNNTRKNLRFCTKQQNSAYAKVRSDSKSGLKGVRKTYNRYSAEITHHGKREYLGSFPTAVEAALAYNNASIKYNGEFAGLNKID